MPKWSYGDFILHLVVYTQGAYTAKDIEALADSVWKKQESPRFKLIQMETDPHAIEERIFKEDYLEEYQDEYE